MATTKTLTPTNQAITLAAFTEKPDNRTNVTNDDKMADAINTLNSKFTKTKIEIDSEITTSTTEAYTGVSFTIPGNSYYGINASSVFSNARPLATYILSSSTQFEDFRIMAGGPYGCATMSGYQKTQMTFYVWAKYSASNTNTIRVRGWYETV